jgi:hypothetical protein
MDGYGCVSTATTKAGWQRTRKSMTMRRKIMKQEQMRKILLADIENMIDDTIPRREGAPRGGGWNKRRPDRTQRGFTRQAWVEYQRSIGG